MQKEFSFQKTHVQDKDKDVAEYCHYYKVQLFVNVYHEQICRCEESL